MTFLQIVSTIVALAAAVASLYFVISQGKESDPVVFKALGLGWVLSPYIILLVMGIVYKSWPPGKRSAVFKLMIIISIISVCIYSRLFDIPGSDIISIAVLTPLFSIILVAVVVPVAGVLARRNEL